MHTRLCFNAGGSRLASQALGCPEKGQLVLLSLCDGMGRFGDLNFNMVDSRKISHVSGGKCCS